LRANSAAGTVFTLSHLSSPPSILPLHVICFAKSFRFVAQFRLTSCILISLLNCSVMSSFESMSPSLEPADWSPHSAKMYSSLEFCFMSLQSYSLLCACSSTVACNSVCMYERNYPCDSLIAVYFGVLFPPSPPTSPLLLQKFTYLCMIAQVGAPCVLARKFPTHPPLCQTMEMKSDIEVRRSKNEHGTLTWQLGEIWPTGGWGSLEYGTVGWLDGQVIGGRWKPLHHVMEQHLYRDVVAVCGADALCFVKNSNPLEAVFGKLQAVLFDIHSQNETEISSTYLAVAAGPAIQRFCLGDPHTQHDCPSYSSILAAHQCTAASCVVILRLSTLPSEHLTVSEENIVFIVPPANMTIPASSVSFKVSQPHDCALRPFDTCSTVTLRCCLLSQQQTYRRPTGFSFRFNRPGHVCYSCHQGTGKIFKKQHLPDHWRSQRRISSLWQAPRLAAAELHQGRPPVPAHDA
jgi:hypothetical protein